MLELSAAAMLFDMDGTLVDSTAVVERAWIDFAVRHGLRAEEVIAFSHGRPAIATVRRFVASKSDIEQEAARIRAIDERATDVIAPIVGAPEFVHSLPSDRWAIVTSAHRNLALKRLVAAGIPVPEVLVTVEDVTIGKPDPQGYRRAAATLGVDITDCVVFEDSLAGVQAGVASGASTVVVGGLTYFDGRLPRIVDFDELNTDPDGDQIHISPRFDPAAVRTCR
ncbi:HAD-IA family hydrolase [Antrihabitans stalactiti]|uniref:HAD family hydrolase n=1 Tax=Antrihabitans stalactiti TaxID=2584121 RepID=A0A848KBZ9_9NOCA|nr:HAD-IA family hydrolase [Antrihabitans stalactiti]NMN96413.1 HAD family hydrolase [Antrihabitans stalactiti]